MRRTVSVRRGGFLCARIHQSCVHEMRTLKIPPAFVTPAMFQSVMSALNVFASCTTTQAHTFYSITAYNGY